MIKKLISKTRQKLNNSGRDFLGMPGLEKAAREANGSRIVLYHGICKKNHTRFNARFLTREIFETHLQLYKQFFAIISLDDFFQGKFIPGRFNVAICFDDGYANNHEYVAPLLERYELPARFFITSIRNERIDILWNDFMSMMNRYGPKQIEHEGEIYVNSGMAGYLSRKNHEGLADQLRQVGYSEKEKWMNEWNQKFSFRDKKDDEEFWLQLSESQIKDLAKSKWVTIGSHGYYHNDLTKLNPEDAIMEMRRSKEWLEKLTHCPVKSIAFPYGSYTRELIGQAKEMGYTQLLATDFLFAEDSKDGFLRGRFTVNPYISPINQAHSIIKGHYAS